MFLGQYQFAFARKFLVRFDTDIDVQIALRSIGDGFAMLAQKDGSSVIDTSWNLEVDPLTLFFHSLAVTDAAGFFRHLTGAVTSRTNAGLLDIAEDGPGSRHDLAGAAAGVTSL
jgi:hypothetical protein